LLDIAKRYTLYLLFNYFFHMKKIILVQFGILLVGVLFAWTNFSLEMIAWLRTQPCPTGCALPGTNPFLTPCFGGAIFFTAAFICSCVLLSKSRHNQN